MEYAVQLALMAKATQVFGDTDTQLSFPITPLAFSPQALDLQSDPTFGRLIEFSALVNRLPEGRTWSAGSDRMLWDVYGRVLREGEYAESSRSASEEADYQAACTVLYTQGEDGLRTPTSAALAYNHYRDEYLLQQQDYLGKKATAEASGEAGKAQWSETIEPLLRETLDNAMADWESLGFRYEIEQAKEQVRSLGAKSPLLTKSEWLNHFSSDLDVLTRATDQMQVYSTSYAPANALAEGAWRSFELSGAEIDTALAEAPSDLREKLTGNDRSHGIASIQFEFSSALLVRPWFNSDALTARFWRFTDPSLQLCDGGAPPRGLCPAYPVALVFARKVRVQPNQATNDPNVETQDLSFDLSFDQTAVSALSKLRFHPQAVLPLRKRELVRDAIRLQEKPSLRINRSSVNPTMLPSLRFSAFERVIRPIAPVPPRLQVLHRFDRLNLVKPFPPAVRPTEDEGIHVLAFICRTLPKSPDPDETLFHW